MQPEGNFHMLPCIIYSAISLLLHDPCVPALKLCEPPCVQHTWCPLASSRISFHQLFFLSFLFSTGSNPEACKYIVIFFFFSLKNLSATKLLAATVPFTAVFPESLSTVNSIRLRILDIRFSAVFPVFRIVPGQGSTQMFVEWILCLKFFSCCLWLNS